MAQERGAPWSRWDNPASNFVPLNNEPLRQQYDAPTGAPLGAAVGSPLVNYPEARLLNYTNSPDPLYYNCYYGVPNNPRTLVDLCLRDLGCCETTCCPNYSWQDKYGWAVALIIVFGAVVLIAGIIWLLVWLFNRAQDKRQRRYFESGQGISPASSQVSVAPPPPPGYGANYGPGAKDYRY
uniref:CX domain-containing protein n=1 Tax=Steinernema glaseri TaxID=37863 RepID=A0A1I7Y3Q8_9BILA